MFLQRRAYYSFCNLVAFDSIAHLQPSLLLPESNVPDRNLPV
jgi:hypothetical protein